MRIDPDRVVWSAPESERAGRPLMLMMHGHGSNETVGFDLRHQLPADLVIASIRAPLRAGPGYAWFPLDSTLSLEQIDDVSHGVLEWLEEQPAASSVGVLGFSQGSAIALQTMRLAPAWIDYGVVLSGFVVPGAAAGDAELRTRRPPVFWGRGEFDPIIPSFLVEATQAWLSRHTSLTQRTYPGLGHNVNATELADLAAFLQDQLG
jgi:phospholipase/carboxylesterase